MTPAAGAGDFAQAMMDLGATICRPESPDCLACPLIERLRRVRQRPPEAFRRRRSAVRPQRYGIARWIERDGACVAGAAAGRAACSAGWRRCPGRMDATPRRSAQPLARVRHVFTHFALELAVMANDEPGGDGWWQPLDQLDEAGLPTLYRRAAQAVLASAPRPIQTPDRALEEAPTPA